MGQVNSNDMDDLFKRASDKYPLRTDSADWNKVAADLERDPSLILPPVSLDDNRRRRRRFFWLFLLLPLGGLGYYTWHAAHNEVSRTTTHENNSAEGTSSSDGKPTGSAYQLKSSDHPAVPVTEKEITGTTAGNEQLLSAAGKTKRSQAAATDQPSSSKGTRTAHETRTQASAPASDRSLASVRPMTSITGRTNSFASAPNIKNSTGPNRARTPQSAKNIAGLKNAKGEENTATTENPGNTASIENLKPAENVHARVPASTPAAKAVSLPQRAPMPPAYAVNIPVKGKDSPAPGAAPKKDKKKKQSSFYAGLLAAPDLSTVRFQSVKGTGTTFGLLLGYQLNPRWSIETGIYDDRKKYYTEGDYFDKSKIPTLRYANLLNVDGICNMWEIPVNIRYNLNTSARMKWFATAGLSTYLMTHENYDYQYISYGATLTKSWQGANTSKYPFSIFNLSIGYEQRLGNIGSLRLEPYLRVPLSGIGTGNLHIMSTGLNIGFTRKLW